MKQFAKHLAFATLADYVDGQLAEPARAEAERHLDTCATCRATLASVQRMTAALLAGELAAAPPVTVAQAVKLFRPLTRAAPESKSPRLSLLALLRFDSGAAPAFGLRGDPGAHLPAQQMVFSAGEYDLDMRIEPLGDGWRVVGQLLGGEAAGAADLIGAEHRYASKLNELGEFGFAAVLPGVYQLFIALPTVDLVIPELRVGA